VEKVGGKSASLGEMISQLSDVGVPVPGLSAVKGLDLIYLMDLEGNQPITIRKSRPKKQEILEIYIITKDK
jgi:catechol-2,3-dioxygenase